MADIRLANVLDPIAAYLHAQTGRPAGEDIPNPRPLEFAEVIVTGGYRVNRVTEAVMVTVICDGPTKAAAFAHALAAATALDELTEIDGHHVYHTDVVGRPAWSPDPDTERPRYQLTITYQYRNTQAP